MNLATFPQYKIYQSHNYTLVDVIGKINNINVLLIPIVLFPSLNFHLFQSHLFETIINSHRCTFLSYAKELHCLNNVCQIIVLFS